MLKNRALVMLVVAALGFLGWRWLSAAAMVVSAYSAKQLCSGVYVAGLPESFVVEKDIHTRLAPLGPGLHLLDLSLDESSRSARASLLGVEAGAIYWPGLGCILHPAVFPPRGAAAAAQAAAEPMPAVLAGEQRIAKVIEEAFAEPGEGLRQTLAVVVLHRGYVVAEHYRASVTPLTPLQGWSMNKSLMATWVGLQVEQGQLSLQQTVRGHLEQLEEPLASSVNPELRLDHLLHMESGLEFEEAYLPGDDVTRMLYVGGPMWRVPLGQRHEHAPGTFFSYSSGDTNVASFIWQTTLGELDYVTWLQQNFYGPLGIRRAISEPDSSGVQVGSSYTYMTAREWARVGQLWLDAWHGRSDLLSEEWQRAATRPRESASRGEYGRGFWLNSQGLAFPDLPRDLFYAGGDSGQYVVVFPRQELVVVRLGLTVGEASTGLDALLEGVLDAVQGEG